MRRAHLPPTTSVSGASNKRRHVVTTVACPPHRQARRTHTLHTGLGHHAHDHHVTVIAPPMARAMASRAPHRTRPRAGSRPRHGPRRTAPEQYEHENREGDHHAHQRAVPSHTPTATTQPTPSTAQSAPMPTVTPLPTSTPPPRARGDVHGDSTGVRPIPASRGDGPRPLPRWPDVHDHHQRIGTRRWRQGATAMRGFPRRTDALRVCSPGAATSRWR